MKSEFGKGLTYCLGLFLAHEGRIINDLKVYKQIGNEERAFGMWFYSSADHIFELETENVPIGMSTRLKRFKNRVMSLRLPMKKEEEATKEDFFWAIKEAKLLLRMIDGRLDVKTREATWE